LPVAQTQPAVFFDPYIQAIDEARLSGHTDIVQGKERLESSRLSYHAPALKTVSLLQKADG
jgi:hypothetical protein